MPIRMECVILSVIELVGSLFLKLDSLVIVELTDSDISELIARIDLRALFVSSYGCLFATKLKVNVTLYIVKRCVVRLVLLSGVYQFEKTVRVLA